MSGLWVCYAGLVEVVVVDSFNDDRPELRTRHGASATGGRTKFLRSDLALEEVPAWFPLRHW